MQTGECAGIVITIADKLQTRTGMHAVVTGLFVLTTLGHTDTLKVKPSSNGSVNVDSESRLFRARPDIVLK